MPDDADIRCVDPEVVRVNEVVPPTRDIALPDYVALPDDEDEDVSILALIRQQDAVFNDTARLRADISNKLSTALNSIPLDLVEQDSEVVAKQMVAASLQLKVQRDREQSFSARIGIRLKNKETNTNAITGKVVASVLKQLELGSVVFSPRPEVTKIAPFSEDELSEFKELSAKDADTISDIELRTNAEDYS